MDNMAYLQQIAGVDNSAAQKAGKNSNGILKKIFNVWTLLGVVVLTVILVVVAVVVNSMNQVDTKDQDYMVQSYWTASNLSLKTITKYANQVKNSDIRNMSASLNSVLQEIIQNYKEIMNSVYSVKVESFNAKNNDIVAKVEEVNTKLNDTLEDGRLNGILDRVYLREMTLQIAHLRSYQAEIKERTSKSGVKDFAEKTESNLGNLYNQFFNFKSNTI